MTPMEGDRLPNYIALVLHFFQLTMGCPGPVGSGASSITNKIWAACCAQTRMVSPNHRHKLLNFKFRHPAYITLTDQHKYDQSRSSECPKCHIPGTDFLHMTWVCRCIARYWSQIVFCLYLMLEIGLEADPLNALLGFIQDFPKSTRWFTAMALLMAKSEIAIHWGKRQPPNAANCFTSMTHFHNTSELYASLHPDL